MDCKIYSNLLATGLGIKYWKKSTTIIFRYCIFTVKSHNILYSNTQSSTFDHDVLFFFLLLLPLLTANCNWHGRATAGHGLCAEESDWWGTGWLEEETADRLHRRTSQHLPGPARDMVHVLDVHADRLLPKHFIDIYMNETIILCCYRPVSSSTRCIHTTSTTEGENRHFLKKGEQ